MSISTLPSRRSTPGVIAMHLLLLPAMASVSSLEAGQNEREEPTLCFEEVGGNLVSVPCPSAQAPATSSPGSRAGVPAMESPAGAPRGPATRDVVARIAGPGDESAALDLFESLVAQGADIVPALVTVFHDGKSPYEQRWVAGRALGRIPCEASLNALTRGLSDKASLVRMAAAAGLKDLGSRSAVPFLVDALDDEAAMVRAAVLDAIGELGTQREVQVVAQELTSPHNFVKGNGIFVRAHAVRALQNLGDTSAVPALISVADDPDPATREAARDALLKLTGRTTVPPGEGTVGERWRRWWEVQGHEK